MSGSNPDSTPRKVVGVQLTRDSLVPVVIMKAAGDQAEHLLNNPHLRGDVPVVRSTELTTKLYRIPIDQSVTPELFPMMAALLAHVIHIDRFRQFESHEVINE